MASVGELELRGASGSNYTFRTYEWGTTFEVLRAVYVIGHMILYVGETNDLSTEYGLEASRRVVESDLINFYDPACND